MHDRLQTVKQHYDSGSELDSRDEAADGHHQGKGHRRS
jgi:hypothetical protein